MKQYVIDGIRPADMEKIRSYVADCFENSGIDHLYWIPLDSDILSKGQASHTKCHPLCVALELLPERVVCELLVRTTNRIKCSCMAYATEQQRNWLFDLIDDMLEELTIDI